METFVGDERGGSRRAAFARDALMRSVSVGDPAALPPVPSSHRSLVEEIVRAGGAGGDGKVLEERRSRRERDRTGTNVVADLPRRFVDESAAREAVALAERALHSAALDARRTLGDRASDEECIREALGRLNDDAEGAIAAAMAADASRRMETFAGETLHGSQAAQEDAAEAEARAIARDRARIDDILGRERPALMEAERLKRIEAEEGAAAAAAAAAVAAARGSDDDDFWGDLDLDDDENVDAEGLPKLRRGSAADLRAREEEMDAARRERERQREEERRGARAKIEAWARAGVDFGAYDDASQARPITTLVPIRPRRRGERRSLRTLLPGASLHPGSLAFNPDTPRRLSTPRLTPLNSTPTFARTERP
jgi:hypothetical protein